MEPKGDLKAFRGKNCLKSLVISLGPILITSKILLIFALSYIEKAPFNKFSTYSLALIF